MKKLRVGLIILLAVTLVGGLQFNSLVAQETDEIPEILQLNPSLDFDKEAIKQWANENSWEEARNLVLDAHDRKKVESMTERRTATLYTPIVTWVENYYKAKQRFWGEEKRKEEYKNSVDYPNEGAYFLYGFATGEKLELKAKDLRFVLEDKEGKHWVGQNVRLRDQTEKNILGIIVYFYAVDVEFNFPEDKIPNWEKLTLYVIRTDLVGERYEFTWDFN